jgi:hypothetical protein
LRFKIATPLADIGSTGVCMPIQLLCPNLRCRKLVGVPDELRGKNVKCQHCQTMFRVPDTRMPATVATVAAGKPAAK